VGRVDSEEWRSGLRLCGWGLKALAPRLDQLTIFYIYKGPGYDPFEGISLEELGRERQKWTTSRQFLESELRVQITEGWLGRLYET
jgi:hypothetical protein